MICEICAAAQRLANEMKNLANQEDVGFVRIQRGYCRDEILRKLRMTRLRGHYDGWLSAEEVDSSQAQNDTAEWALFPVPSLLMLYSE